MSNAIDYDLIRRMIHDDGVTTRRFIEAKLNNLKEDLMSALDTATAAAEAQLAALTTEVSNANAKTDAALAALQQSLANQTPVTQAQIDAITTIGNQAAAAIQSLQAEEAKVDTALAPQPAPDSGSSDSATGS